MRTLGLLLLLTLCAGISVAQTPTALSYTNPNDCTTSAGIYDGPAETAHLLRTLWSGTYTIAGSHAYTWDGLNDLGVAVTGTVYPRVLCSNAQYNFDGPIGRTDSNWYTQSDTLVGYTYAMSGLRFAFPGNGFGYASTNYAEGTQELYKFYPSNPNGAFPLTGNPNSEEGFGASGSQWSFNDIDTDGSYLYTVEGDAAYPNLGYFVTKLNLNGTGAVFSGSTAQVITNPNGLWRGTPLSVIAYTTSGSSPLPITVAVQQSGNLLAVGYAGTTNQIVFYDKNTGAAVGTPVSITAPSTTCFTSAGLWVILRITK